MPTSNLPAGLPSETGHIKLNLDHSLSLLPHTGSSLHLLANYERLYLQEDKNNPEILYAMTETGQRLFNVTYKYKTVIVPTYTTGIASLITSREETVKLVQAIKVLDNTGRNIMSAELAEEIDVYKYNHCVEYDIQVDNQKAGRFRRDGCCSQSCHITWTDIEQNGELELTSEGCCCCCQLLCCPCAITSFQIKQTGLEGEGQTVVGKMSEKWPENPGVFGVQFPKSMSVLGKTMVLASTLVLNRNFFTKEECCGVECRHVGTSGCRCITMWIAVISAVVIAIPLTLLGIYLKEKFVS